MKPLSTATDARRFRVPEPLALEFPNFPPIRSLDDLVAMLDLIAPRAFADGMGLRGNLAAEWVDVVLAEPELARTMSERPTRLGMKHAIEHWLRSRD